ncbi:MAG: 3-deoxy-manno-octulosonate cytidylyltransferase [Bacteroidia bacterium]
MQKTLAIIPARYASTRFPGKPLIDIAGKTMIERVYRQVKKATAVQEVIVATDDDRIAAVVKHFGGLVEMTSDQHPSGTDRCAEVANRFRGQFDVVINVQGDEPFINPEQISLLCVAFEQPEVTIATLCKQITDEETLHNPNVVKVVKNAQNKAMYFSRQAIPYLRNHPQPWFMQHLHYKHLGIYAFRLNTLLELTKLKPSGLELAESLEQLRWLENGYSIALQETQHETLAIDSPADLEFVEKYLKSLG